MTAVSPYTTTELSQTLESLGVGVDDKLLVAVSGGADSLALALLSHEVRTVVTATVDHGLRPAAADEAKQVGIWMNNAAIPHQILTWDGDKPAANIQAEARAIRYRLLEQAARKLGCTCILTAHHQDDQAETFLVRLARGSGLAGLAGMTSVARIPGCSSRSIQLVRPLLAVPRSRLEECLKSRGQCWINDPSNDDHRFARVQARTLLADPPLENLTADRITSAARSLARARDALVWYEERLFEDCAKVDEWGFVTLDHAKLKAAPVEVGYRLLARLLAWIGNAEYPPRFEKVQGLYNALEGDLPGRTLGGVRVEGSRGHVIMMRENAACPGFAASDNSLPYDGRWSGVPEGLKIGYSGTRGVPDLDECDPALELPVRHRGSVVVRWAGGGPAVSLRGGINASMLPVFPEKQEIMAR